MAPETSRLVRDLAQRTGCTTCAFYRNEKRPNAAEGQGPPYGLLQGRIDVAEVAPHEGNIPVKPGHVCFIPGTKDFFISLTEHEEWGTSHTVWGQVNRAPTVLFFLGGGAAAVAVAAAPHTCGGLLLIE